MTAHPSVRWYFDFVSPFCYLQHYRLRDEAIGQALIYAPVLFAGLLGHWSHKGPAEIPLKRELTYRYCHWFATQHGIPFRFPPAHPFNPLPWLRLAIACECEARVVTDIFDRIWRDGADGADPDQWHDLARQFGIADVDQAISDPDVKTALRHNTEAAISRGVFGVPTLEIGGAYFWGQDMTEMALTYFTNAGAFESSEYHRLAALPSAAARQ